MLIDLAFHQAPLGDADYASPIWLLGVRPGAVSGVQVPIISRTALAGARKWSRVTEVPLPAGGGLVLVVNKDGNNLPLADSLSCQVQRSLMMGRR